MSRWVLSHDNQCTIVVVAFRFRHICENFIRWLFMMKWKSKVEIRSKWNDVFSLKSCRFRIWWRIGDILLAVSLWRSISNHKSNFHEKKKSNETNARCLGRIRKWRRCCSMSKLFTDGSCDLWQGYWSIDCDQFTYMKYFVLGSIHGKNIEFKRKNQSSNGETNLICFVIRRWKQTIKRLRFSVQEESF